MRFHAVLPLGIVALLACNALVDTEGYTFGAGGEGGAGAAATSGGGGQGGATGGGGCGAGTADCDDDPGDCETDLYSALEHCGGCGRACDTANVLLRVCVGGLCQPGCALGFASCVQPVAPAVDDGCEQPIDVRAHCGGCAVDCGRQGECKPETQTCGCLDAGSCDNGGECSEGLCDCGTGPCAPGETCGLNGCTCGDSSTCDGGQVCCPGGCSGLLEDSANCGACGNACPRGEMCANGGCVPE